MVPIHPLAVKFVIKKALLISCSVGVLQTQGEAINLTSLFNWNAVYGKGGNPGA